MAKIDELLKKCCERCENYSVEAPCEDTANCPVYALYKEKKKVRTVNSNNWAIPPAPRPEMI